MLGTSWNLDLVLLLLFSKELSLQALLQKEMITREKVGERESQFLQHDNEKFQVSLYATEEIGSKTN